MADILEEIQNNFPMWAWAFEDPELGPLLRDAVDPGIGFSPNTFQAKVMGTNWWRSRSAAVRNYDILKHTDPGQLQAQRDELAASVAAQARALGVPLDFNELQYVVEGGLLQGWSASDPRMVHALGSFMLSSGRTGTGAIETIGRDIDQTARKKHFLAGMNDAREWAIHVATGSSTMEDVEREMHKRSVSLYPHLADQLNSGASMMDIFSGHIGLIADELELSPEQVDLTRGVWSKVINTYDVNASKHRAMTLSETRTLAREEPQWWKTARGKAMEAQMGDFLLKSFGRRS